MIHVQLESWAAIAPGLDTKNAWLKWLQQPTEIPDTLGPFPLPSIAPMIRRRFSPLGKCAMGAILQLPQGDMPLPAIFASRHGDTTLTLSLLENMSRGEPMSPTGFSLAVHNAVSGLYSIAGKDTSAITAIAATEGLILQTLFEAAGQLQETEKVLCVIYDVSLPDLYKRFATIDTFPYAIAMILSRTGKTSLYIEPHKYSEHLTTDLSESKQKSKTPLPETEPIRFISLLADQSASVELTSNGALWSITKACHE